MSFITRISEENRALLVELAGLLEYRFRDWCNLQKALVHRSYAFEMGGGGEDNENLEFLGDAVLGLSVGHLLFKRYPEMREGELTRLRAALVNEVHLAAVASDMDLGRFLFLGHGEDISNGRAKSSILSCAFEAVCGAVFIDGGYQAVNSMIERIFLPRVEGQKEVVNTLDPKTRLQEVTQERFAEAPLYSIEKESGPDHDKSFLVAVSLGGKTLATGEAGSKKKAEQAAAARALEVIEREDD